MALDLYTQITCNNPSVLREFVTLGNGRGQHREEEDPWAWAHLTVNGTRARWGWSCWRVNPLSQWPNATCVHGGVDDEGALLSALDLRRRAPGPAEVGPTKEREVSGLEHVSAREASFLSFSLSFFSISYFQISNSKVDLNEVWMSNLIQMLSQRSSMLCKFYFIYWLIYSPRQILYIYIYES